MALESLSEVTPDTSSDDIKAYAAQVIQEVTAERAGEQKSDAQITNEHADTPQPGDKPTKTPAEGKSGSNTAHDEGEVSGAAEGPEWLTDDVKAEATAYGIDETELSGFASREEFDRALRLFDKSALEAGRKAMAEGQTRNERGQFAKKDESKADQPKEETPKDGRYQVSLNPDLYDEEIISEFARMRDFYESRLSPLEAYVSDVMAKAEEQRFDSLVDSLGHADLFGTTGKESEKELERRKDLNVAVNAQLIGLAQLGRPAEMSPQLISRVANMVFGDELGKKLLKQQTRKISRQSDGRLGGSPTKPTPPSDDPREAAERRFREMSGHNQ